MTDSICRNGEALPWPQAMAVAQALQQWQYHGERVAVAINGEFVPRSAWALRVIHAGDAVDVLAPVQGG